VSVESEATIFYTIQLTNRGGKKVLLRQVNNILVPFNNAWYFTNLTSTNYSVVSDEVCNWFKKNLCMHCKSTWTQTLLEAFIFKI